MKNKFIFLILFFSLSFALGARAEIKTVTKQLGDITINRIAPDSAYLGQKIWITLVFENNSSAQKTIVLKENLGNADFDKAEAKKIETEYGETFWYYEWKIQLKAGDNTLVSYWLIPKEIGQYTISPGKITIASQDYNLGSWNINVECLADGKCDLSAGENYLNCPYDCSTGLADNLCDAAQDGRCDPDCEQGVDPDCAESPEKSKNYYIYYLAAGVIIAGLIAAVIIKKKISKK